MQTDVSAELTVKETEILSYGEKLDLLDIELSDLKLQIARLEVKKIETMGIRRQASHILSRLKIEAEQLKRRYFSELRGTNP